MALSTSRSVYGIHSIATYNPATFEPYGIAKLVGSLSLTFSGEQVPLNGGSLLYPWQVEKGVISTEGSFLLREVPDWTFEALQGAAATVNAAEANGAVTTLSNVKGASIVAATGIASVSLLAGSAVDVKSGMYVVKAASATTVDVYALSDVDFLRGADLVFVNDSLKITSSPLTITTGGDVNIPSIGLKFTGGAGTIGMTAGDTAWFDARSQNQASRTVTVGKSGETIPDIGILCAAQKKGSGEIFFLDIFKVAASGFPYNFTEKAWMESEVSFQAFYDAQRNGVYREIYVDGV
jgi:hypothetical protein